MGIKVLIVPDKFKGTLTAEEAANAIARGWRTSRPSDQLSLVPMSDGGDGFGPILGGILGASTQRTETVDAAHRPCIAEWWWQPEQRLAIIEAARVNGLAMLPKGKFHPFQLDTFGLGEVFKAAAALGARRCLIGIGGSSTNDGGFGLAKALGWKFKTGSGASLEQWTELGQLESIVPPATALQLGEVLVAVDVQNPLLGSRGCSRIYGPQKGLTELDFPSAEAALSRLAEKVALSQGRRPHETPGSGAAGGLGFGLVAFLNADLTPGFDLFDELSGLEQRIREVDLVVTGEGSIDASSLMGKGVGGVVELCQRLGKPCLGFAGVTADPHLLATKFKKVHPLAPQFTTVDEALTRPALHLERLATEVASGLIQEIRFP